MEKQEGRQEDDLRGAEWKLSGRRQVAPSCHLTGDQMEPPPTHAYPGPVGRPQLRPRPQTEQPCEHQSPGLPGCQTFRSVPAPNTPQQDLCGATASEMCDKEPGTPPQLPLGTCTPISPGHSDSNVSQAGPLSPRPAPPHTSWMAPLPHHYDIRQLPGPFDTFTTSLSQHSLALPCLMPVLLAQGTQGNRTHRSRACGAKVEDLPLGQHSRLLWQQLAMHSKLAASSHCGHSPLQPCPVGTNDLAVGTIIEAPSLRVLCDPW